MNYEDNLYELINIYEEKIGLDSLKEFLVNRINENESNNLLTIVANQGLHKIPSRFIHGEIYIASSGNLNFNNKEVIIEQYNKILSNLKSKLCEKEWNKVYLVPTGHSTLALQIKSMVYHILRIDTIDLFYNKGEYYEIEINVRSLL